MAILKCKNVFSDNLKRSFSFGVSAELRVDGSFDLAQEVYHAFLWKKGSTNTRTSGLRKIHHPPDEAGRLPGEEKLKDDYGKTAIALTTPV